MLQNSGSVTTRINPPTLTGRACRTVSARFARETPAWAMLSFDYLAFA
jgi:hypothetical protein